MLDYKDMFRCVVISLIITVAACKSHRRYRHDYQYNPNTDAFYKLHTEYASYVTASSSCKAESAKLIQPLHDDKVQAHGMLKDFPDIIGEVWIRNEIEDEVKDETTIRSPVSRFGPRPRVLVQSPTDCEVMTRKGDTNSLGCQSRRPFICKVDAKDAIYDSKCKVFSKGYIYYETVRSCYKFSHVAYSWNQAYDECLAEGAHLIILNSELEHQLIHNLTFTAPIIPNAQTNWSWYAGIRAQKPADGSPVVFKTIFGKTLREAGYDQWSENEPNNAGGKEYCGSIFKNDGKYNDLECAHLYGFICEKETT